MSRHLIDSSAIRAECVFYFPFLLSSQLLSFVLLCLTIHMQSKYTFLSLNTVCLLDNCVTFAWLIAVVVDIVVVVDYLKSNVFVLLSVCTKSVLMSLVMVKRHLLCVYMSDLALSPFALEGSRMVDRWAWNIP